ncbi:MAG: hypothetical protein SH868_12195 [Bythopirellula sp.]|nr:hypothetical protein [Bythopirellula sp.]
MPLIDEITRLRDETLSSLDTIHNYYFHTKSAWRIVQQVVRKGNKFTIRNRATGSIVDETELSGLAQAYVTGLLASATFQHFVSVLERFVSDFLSLWLTEYPNSLSGKELKFKTVLDATDKNKIVATVVEKELLELAYQRISDWFLYLEKIAQLGCPISDQIERLTEIKASRDVLVHNNGIVNSVYVGKSMGRARFVDGDKLVLPEDYHRDSWELIKQVVKDVSNAAIKKLEK